MVADRGGRTVDDDPMHERTILRISVGLEDPEDPEDPEDLWADLERLFTTLLSA